MGLNRGDRAASSPAELPCRTPSNNALADGAAVWLATGLYLSYIPSTLLDAIPRAKFFEWTRGRRWTGAGLMGTVEGLILAPLLPAAPLRFCAFWACAVAVACWLCDRAEKAFGVHDDPRIVLDEVVGFWTAIAFLPPRLPVWMAAFVLFRVLDSWKLPPWSWLERLPGGLGVVADDVGAGVAANIGLRILLWFVPWFGL